MKQMELEKLKLKKLEQLQQKRKYLDNLPHLYGFPLYPWAREFFESRNHMCLLVAGNQLSKSSTQIRKCIHWATEKELWPELWPKSTPRQFWYLYPSMNVATAEVEMKWIPEFLPREDMKTHPQYGWNLKYKHGQVHYLEFNTGIRIYFHAYSKDVHKLQSGTVHCFTEGHLIATKEGLKRIEDVRVTDYVITRKGFRRVMVSRNEVGYVSQKVGLEATDSHPIWVNNSWVSFKDLNPGDKLTKLPLWKLIKKLFYLKESIISVTQRMRILEERIILEATKGSYSTLPFGKRILGVLSLPAMLFITKTLTHWITHLETWSVLQSQNILEFINSKNGNSSKRSLLHVPGVVRTFFQGVLKELYLGIAPNPVERRHIGNARQRKRVYNIQVEDCPEYFCENILTHNSVFTDEELPSALYDELSFRIAASDGYFNMVFTATRGEDLWYRAMERRGKSDEAFKTAHKIRVSAFDCQFYEDGSESPWTEKKIKKVIATCATENEVLKRVYGRFVVDDGLLIPEFRASVNVVEPYDIPKDWLIYGGVDVGSGGKDGHKGAIAFVAVNPDFTKAAVFKGWKGNDKETTTAADILDKYRLLRGNLKPVQQFYDWASKDFFTFASRLGESFTKAEKSHEIGVDTINTLFKLKMLDIFDLEELQPLIFELQTLTKADVDGRAKRHADDDLYDGVRYVVTSIPWDWTSVAEEYAEPKEKQKTPEFNEIEERRKMMDWEEEDLVRIDEEIAEFNELYG